MKLSTLVGYVAEASKEAGTNQEIKKTLQAGTVELTDNSVLLRFQRIRRLFWFTLAILLMTETS